MKKSLNKIIGWWYTLKVKEVKHKSYIHDDEHYYKIIRKNIREHRLNKKLTQQDLADMTELSREYICDIENESRNKHPTISVLGRIAESLDVEIMNFFVEQAKLEGEE